jgi:angio-associated migratory cell protein
LWDIKANHPVLDVKAGENPGHSEAVISIAPDCENNLFITGSEDGTALLIGPSGPLGALNPDSGSVEAVLIDCPDFDIKVAATGSCDKPTILNILVLTTVCS